MNTVRSIAAAAALAAAAAVPSAHAAAIDWELGPTFGGALGHEGILLNGTLVEAIDLGGTPGGVVVVDPTGLNLTFNSVNSPSFTTPFVDPANTIGDAGWSTIIKTFEWTSSVDVNAATFLSGLTIGATYQVQFFAARTHPCCLTRTQRYGDGEGNFSDMVAFNAFQSVVGTFVADATTQRIIFDDSTNNPMLAAYVLRDVTAVPEPASWALMAVGVAGLLARRRSSQA